MESTENPYTRNRQTLHIKVVFQTSVIAETNSLLFSSDSNFFTVFASLTRMDLLLVIEHDAYYKQKGYPDQNNFCSKDLVNQIQENTRKTAQVPKGIIAPILRGS